MRRRAVGQTVLFATMAIILGSIQPVWSQQFGTSGQVGERERETPAGPVPRWPGGRVNLGPPAGEEGLWLPFNGGADRVVNPDNMDDADAVDYPNRPRVSEVPFQPWARAVYQFRRGNQLEPHTRCKASGGPRQFLTPYGVEIVDVPELERIYIMDLGGPHTYRTIFMDGRSHPQDLEGSYYGYSIGSWEGDTLVVDTRGFNERFWFDRTGLPHTERLRMIERFTRTDSKTIQYELTIDDPGAYTRAWNTSLVLGWDPNAALFEYICQDNNYAAELMVGTSRDSAHPPSRIVP